MTGEFPAAVAEIGTAHGGSLQKGLDLIDAAADAGADVAKVQVVFADEILPPEAGMVPLPGGPAPLFEVFRSLEQTPEFYAELAARAAKRGIGFLASPFGERSVRLLEDIGVTSWKAASPELNHEPLLERLAATGLPVILSTGVSKLSDIERALDIFNTPNAGAVTLLHCLTSYPAPENEANLRLITTLKSVFGKPAGLSDHSLDPVLLPALASALGAVMVEKHITLDNGAGGLDDPVALTPEAFCRMKRAMDRFASVPVEDAAAELAEEYGESRVQAALGDGVKRLAPSETAGYGRTNRSLHAVGALEAGTILSETNSAWLRTEKVLRPGLLPHERQNAYGRRLRNSIPSGEGIRWEDLAD